MAKPISPDSLRNDVCAKLNNADFESFSALCKKYRITRGELARIAIQRLIKSEAKTAPLPIEEKRAA